MHDKLIIDYVILVYVIMMMTLYTIGVNIVIARILGILQIYKVIEGLPKRSASINSAHRKSILCA